MRGRILWLFNKTSLRKFEVPLLIEMGYEVYCPKICEVETRDFSTSISYEYDSSLSIPENVLEKLNKVDFYQEIDSETMALVNQYFDIVICLAMCTPIKYLARWFNGVLGVHVFGLAGDFTYTQLFYSEEGFGLLDSLRRMGNRFWFMPSYDNLAEIESPLLRNHTIFMPIGMPNAKVNHKWVGGDERFLFISPKIRSNIYYTNIYENFRKNFDDIPHVIGGVQIIPVTDDPTVTGFLPQDEYEYNMTHLAAMYYHSTEKRHIHSHPFEAVRNGMPLVFMAGGMLDHLGGEKLPGRCESITEARKKIKLLSQGDKKLIQQILSTQEILLEPMQKDYCRKYWEEGMRKMDEAALSAKKLHPQRKKVVVVMPESYLGGVLDYSIRLTINLFEEAKKHGDKFDVIFAHPENNIYDGNEYFRELKKRNIQIRTFSYFVGNGEFISRTVTLAGYQPEKNPLMEWFEMTILQDGIANFGDCDYTIFTADHPHLLQPLLWLRPYACVAHDYIQRHVPGIILPEANSVKLNMQRHADKVFVTSQPTYEDAINYGMLKPEKLILTPLMLEMSDVPQILEESESSRRKKKEKPYFLWSTNISKHKNHIVALNALESYYEKGGKLDCVMTGTLTELFDPDNETDSGLYVNTIRNKIKNSDILKSHIKIKGFVNNSQYLRILSKSMFIFSPTYGDNGTGTAYDAASLGVPTLCSDYPAMRYLSEFTGVPFLFTDPFSPDEMTEKLFEIDRSHDLYVNALPSREELANKQYDRFSGVLYDIVSHILFG